ncbi:hypothetical protein [Streptomyces sp. KL116D]|uniref:hypothetical protein n=1 Tax=Streptomyces sp. KL116D TaxID=3045152 RepID=UPI003557567D
MIIDDDSIAWVRTTAKPATDTTYDAAGRAAIPGFVDSHSTSSSPATAPPGFNARMSARATRRGRASTHHRRR